MSEKEVSGACHRVLYLSRSLTTRLRGVREGSPSSGKRIGSGGGEYSLEECCLGD